MEHKDYPWNNPLFFHYLLVISYDGTNYNGWQDTGEKPSIEKALKAALKQLIAPDISLLAASRTDRGVHALGQVIKLSSPKKISNLPKFLYSLNCLLPKSISAKSIQSSSLDFHPSLDVVSKLYVYSVWTCKTPCPFIQRFSWHVPKTIDFGIMKAGAKILIGEHDFTSLTNQKDERTNFNPYRKVHDIEINPQGDLLKIHVHGQSFSYKMVRNIVGSLLDLGMQRLSLKDFTEGFHAKQRKRLGQTAPAHGLQLVRIKYDCQDTGMTHEKK